MTDITSQDGTQSQGGTDNTTTDIAVIAQTSTTTQSPASDRVQGDPTDVAQPAGDSTTGNIDESLVLLRKIDANIGMLTVRLENVEKVAIRNGAVAGAVAGSLTGGIVATGIAFARAKLGF